MVAEARDVSKELDISEDIMTAIATPALVARAISSRVARESAPKPVFSTTTGDVRPSWKPTQVEIESFYDDLDGPFCYVCSRCTDHFAEHDDMIEAGTARYGLDGSVYAVS